MKRFWLVCLCVAASSGLRGQFSTDQLQVRIGYSIHNAYATRFNHLIESFNNARYPVEIADNLPSVNFLHGLHFGANYNFREDMALHLILKSKHKFIEVPYVNYPENRQFYFRENTMEAGITFALNEDETFQHFAGGGIALGYMSIFTDWTPETRFQGTKEMLNIDHTAVVGLNLSYEARLRITDGVQLFLRPVAQFTLPSHVRNLNEFMNPQVSEGVIQYSPDEPEKYNNGSLSGLGIEGGLLISLPKFN
jgi:hypothetical protein